MTFAMAVSVAERLGEQQAPGAAMVSGYFRLLPEDRQRLRYLLEARAAATQALESVERADGLVGRAAARDVTRMLGYLGDSVRLPRARGVAIFACEALDLIEAVPLPAVTRTRVRIGSRFAVRELLAAERDFGTILAAVVDRAHARFFDVTAFGAVELPGLASPATRGGKYHSDRQGAPGHGEAAFHGRIREERHRHYDAVVRYVLGLQEPTAPRPLFLAGPGNVAPALLRFLPPGAADRVIGSARLNPTEVTAAAVHAAVLESWFDAQRDADRALVAAVDERVSTGWAVHGVRASLRALAAGQVRTLLVCPESPLRGFRCAASGRLVVVADQCRWEGAPEPVPDLIGEAIEAALAQGAEVRVVRDSTEARRIDGLAALLRFR
jgi:peptide subunit release factor 1 (eRF1)